MLTPNVTNVQPVSTHAGFGERLVAYLIDGVIIAIVSIIPRLILGAILGGLVGWALAIAYFAGFWANGGATPGKMVMGLRVVRTDGRPVDVSTALLRYVGYIVSGLMIGIGFLWIIWDEEKQGLHDKIAKTYVIKE